MWAEFAEKQEGFVRESRTFDFNVKGLGQRLESLLRQEEDISFVARILM